MRSFSRKTKSRQFFVNKCIFDKKSNFLKFPPNSSVTPRCKDLLKKKQLCKTLILKIMDKVSVNLLGQSSHVLWQILRYPYSNACFEKVEKGKIMKCLDSISELISNIDIPEI